MINKYSIILAILLLNSPNIFAFGISGLDTQRFDSVYNAKTLREIPTDAAFFSSTNSAKHLNAVLGLFDGNSAASGKRFALDPSVDATSRTWEGVYVGNPGIQFRFNRDTGRLKVRNLTAEKAVSTIPPISAISEQKGVDIAIGLIARIAQTGAVNISEIDLKNLKITKQITGNAPTKGSGKVQEWVDAYHIAAKRVVDGVPVVGNFVHVAISNQGVLEEIEIANRPLARAKELGNTVPIDVTPQIAIDSFKSMVSEVSTNLSEVQIENWGLAYVDVGAASQSEIQPAYVFIGVPLVKTGKGVAAGRKLIRVIPASSRSIANINPDPFPKEAANSPPVGDAR